MHRRLLIILLALPLLGIGTWGGGQHDWTSDTGKHLFDDTCAPDITPPFTMTAWVWNDDSAAFHSIFWMGDVSSANDWWTVEINASGNVECTARDGGAGSAAVSASALGDAAWHFVACEFVSSTSRFARLDGYGISVGTGEIVVEGLDVVDQVLDLSI